MNQATNQEIREFLSVLFAKYFKKSQGYVELRFISKEDGATFSKFCNLTDFTDASLDEIGHLNNTHNVYFGVNPRPLSKDKREKDVKNIVCLWADVDGKDFDGGKEAALRAIGDFPIPPLIVVDSGHGFHCYWLLKEPITDVSEEARVAFKQVLSGVVKKLGADRTKIPVCSLLRLPGTLNIKDEVPLECKVINMEADLTYKLEDFSEFLDAEYREPAEIDESLPKFGEKSLIITQGAPASAKAEREAAAIADVQRLEVTRKIKRHIITGDLRTEKDKDHTRSGRDQTIIYWLVYSDYDYETTKSIFFNPYLGCSNRIPEEGEESLRGDIARALKFVEENKVKGTPQSRKILEIKESRFIPNVQKPYQINAFVGDDLLKGENAAGNGYKKRAGDQYYFFDREEKILMELEGLDFYLFMRQRYGLLKRDFEEIKDAVKTEIKISGQEVEPRKFAHFDDKSYVLYVSNHANNVYRLDGNAIQVYDNGVDGVFFEFDPKLEPYEFKHELEVVDYFQRKPKDKPIEISGIKFPPREPLGLSLEKFRKSYLDEFLISRAHFGTDDKYGLTPDEQRLLFTLYFYSLFFKSIQLEKPILCFVGLRESGKSFIATSVGKIFFGEMFRPSTFTKEKKDLAVVLGGNYYTVFDNLDSWVANDLLDMLCAAVTGATEDKRELYTDRSQVRFTLDSFVAITSREPKFRRDDVVRRLLLFNTKEITQALGRSSLWKSLMENRERILTEVLMNLNTIVRILKTQRNAPQLPCACRMIADWESLAKKICSASPENLLLRQCLLKMSARKSFFALEEEPLYWVLSEIIYKDEGTLEKRSATDLYGIFLEKARAMKIEDFSERYKNPGSLGRRLSHLRPEWRGSSQWQ